MQKKRVVSIVIALLLLVAMVASMVVESSAVNLNNKAAIVSFYEADDADQPKKKGNAFVRVISAPFRAIGRLFGGGKKTGETAKKKREASHAARTKSASVAPKGGGEKAFEASASGSVAVESGVAPLNVAGANIVRPEAAETNAAPKPPRWIPFIEGIGRDPLSQGRALLQHGYANEAVSELLVAAVVGPDLVEANALLGLAYNRLGNHAAAIESHRRALSLAPNDAQIINNLGYALSLNGQHQDALKTLKRAARLSPGDPYVLNNVAHVQARLGKFSEAYKSFARVVGEYHARLKTAEMLEEAGRTDEALKQYEAARKIEPNSPALLERLAELYERTGRQREAEAARRALGQPSNKQKTATGGGGGE